MSKQNEKENDNSNDKNTLFLRFSGDAISLREWIEQQQKEGGYKSRQDVVLDAIRARKQQAEHTA